MADDPRRVARRLVEEMRQDVAVGPQPRTAKVRPGVWLSGLVAILLLIAFEVGLSMLGDTDAQAVAPARVVAAYVSDSCAQRQAAIMQAVLAYQRDNGRAPDSLSQLPERYLAGPPVDPVSKRPYDYRVDGDRIALSCPNPKAHAAAGR